MTSIGFVLSSEQFSPTRLLDIGVKAEAGGFDMLWMSDHFHPWMDNQGHAGQAWVTLSALGQRVSLPFGTGVTCPTYRYNPAIVAQAFATLGILYPGRVFLGVGTGEAVNEQAATGNWGDYDERSDRLVEAVTLIQRLWRGEWIDFKGRFYTASPARLYDVPDQRVPIYIAAAGDESMRLAGRHGDGLISDGQSATKPELQNAFRQGARESGKSPEQMPINAEVFVFVGKQSETEQAARLWRFIPNAWTKYVDIKDPREILQQAEQDVSLEQVTKSWVVSDDPQVHIDKLKKLVDGGVTNLFIHSGQADQERVIEFYSRHVLPNIEHQRMKPVSVQNVSPSVQYGG